MQKGEHAQEAQAVPIQKLHEMRCAAELEEDKETRGLGKSDFGILGMRFPQKWKGVSL